MSKNESPAGEKPRASLIKYLSGSLLKAARISLNKCMRCSTWPRKYKAFLYCLIFYFICVTPALCEEGFKYSASSRRNPFIPLVTPDGRLLKLDTEQEGNSYLLLEGIIYDKNGVSYAIVNGNVAKIGDKVGDYQVLKIEERKVVFIKEGQPLEVVLKKEE